jgi:cytoskeletal protein CcmA (bactofilin family)
MSSTERRYSSLAVEESRVHSPSDLFKTVDDPTQYFQTWLKELKRSSQQDEAPATPRASENPNERPSFEEFRFEGTLRIDCSVAGRINSATGTIIIGESATAEANLDVAVAIVEGQVHGNIHASDRVEIASRGSVIGNIEAAVISIQPGALFEGRCFFLPAQRPGDMQASRAGSVEVNVPQRSHDLSESEEHEDSLFVAVSR